MLTVTIDVTAKDIEQGIQGEPRLCPLALAVKRATNLVCAVGATSLTTFNNDGYLVSYRLPSEAQDFRRTFDFEGRKHVRPFSFTLEVEDADCEQPDA